MGDFVPNPERKLGEQAMVVIRTDLQGRMLEVNDTLLEMSGFSAEQLLGLHGSALLHADMPAALQTDLSATLKTGRPWISVIRMRCQDGGSFWVESHVTPAYRDGNVDGYLHVGVAPSAAKIRHTCAAHARFQLDQRGDFVIRQGAVVASRTPFDVRDLSIGKRLILCFGGLFALAVLMGMLMLLGLHALLRDMQLAGMDEVVLQHAIEMITRSRVQMLGLLGVFLICAGLMFIWLRQVTTRPLERAAYLFRQMAGGNYHCAIGVSRNNETGRLFQSLHGLQLSLRAQNHLRSEEV